jgi:hypothetical protein
LLMYFLSGEPMHFCSGVDKNNIVAWAEDHVIGYFANRFHYIRRVG